jgi:hypothetical protein
MRIAYQTLEFPARSESWIRVEIAALRDAGHEVVVSTVKKPVRMADCAAVVCHFATLAGRAALAGRPILLIPHANDVWPDRGRQLLNAVRNSDVRAVGCITSYHRQKYVEWGVPERLLRDWPVAVDVDLFADRRRRLGEWVLAGGRNVPKKGLELARAAVPDLVLFGDHPAGVGWLSPAVLAKLMRDAWCFLNTSVVDPATQDRDGLPVTVLEAGCASLRVLTTRVAGLCDLAGLVTFVEPTVESIQAALEVELRAPNVALAKYVAGRHAPAAVARNVERIAGEVL